MTHTDFDNLVQRRRYRAPAESGGILAVPGLSAAAEQARVNASRLSMETVQIAGLPLLELRQRARSEVITAAAAWTNSITGQSIACAECSHHASLLFVTGHQPQLAHAGVWAKNFAASGLAQTTGGLGLNIIVDNDTVGTQSIQLPQGTPDSPAYLDVSFDLPQPQQPWEELKIGDLEQFASFGERVTAAMKPWGITPLIEEMWPTAVACSLETDSMADCLSAARMQQERSWGANNLEIPLSKICGTETFSLFVQHIMLNVEHFHSAYNGAVASYRSQHQIRNHRHPVPDLEQLGNSYEIPFWFWRAGESERGQVFCQRSSNQIELTCRGEVILSCAVDEISAALQTLQLTGKLRTRALTTTLFARLMLADLFIHGIGGAKYDEITDDLMTRFFGIQPPHYLVLSATLHLPVDSPIVTEKEVLRYRTKLRDLRYNPERYLSGPEIDQARARKFQIIEEMEQARDAMRSTGQSARLKRENRLRHLEIKSINKELQRLASELFLQTEAEFHRLESKLKAKRILQSREFPAAIFAAETVRELSQNLLHYDKAEPVTEATSAESQNRIARFCQPKN